MLPLADLTGTRPLTAVEAATPVTSAGDPRREVFNRLTQIALGKTLQADVLSRFDDGTFLIKIADTTLRASLPFNAHIGESLPLKLVATDPRPTFLLTQQSGATTSLSTTGRLIDNLLQAAQQDGASTAVIGKAAILPSATTSSAHIAAALQNALGFSGLFYESHVRQWVDGRRSMADLMREPQARGGTQSAPAAVTPADPSRNALAQLIDIVSEWGEGGSNSKPLASGINTLPGLNHLDSQAVQLINQQLHALENNRIAWQGELWPGQNLEWEVSEDTPQGNTEDGPTTWSSVVRFELPLLGMVAANIHLVGDRVHMQVRTATEDTAAKLRDHGDELASALGAAGSPLDSLMVTQDGQA